jgi:2'-5' RNA ligase
MRLFVALTLPEQVRFRLSLLCCGLPGARWIPPENLHLTLRFIGEVDGGTMQDIDAALAAIRAPGFEMEIAGVGHFGNAGKVRAIWAGIAPLKALQHLHDKIESALVRIGLEPEGQRFHPHVTLTRSNVTQIGKLQEFLAQHSLFRSGPIPVTHFTLYSSFAGSGGSIYRAEESYALTAA